MQLMLVCIKVEIKEKQKQFYQRRDGKELHWSNAAMLRLNNYFFDNGPV